MAAERLVPGLAIRFRPNSAHADCDFCVCLYTESSPDMRGRLLMGGALGVPLFSDSEGNCNSVNGLRTLDRFGEPYAIVEVEI